MTYVIKPVRHEDLDQLYPVGEEKAIGLHTLHKNAWPQDMHNHKWARDDQTGIFLMGLPMERLDANFRYLFGMPGGVALIRQEGHCLYSFLYVSPGLSGRMEEVKAHIREIFKLVGWFIDGTTDESDVFAVPNAQFKN